MSAVVNTETGEITETLDEHAARRITDRIKLLLGSLVEQHDKITSLIAQARDGHASQALGYRSWTEYAQREFAGVCADLARAQRQPIAQQLAEAGMSARAIAPIVGVNHATVARDLSHHATPQAPINQEGGQGAASHDRISAPVESASPAEARLASVPPSLVPAARAGDAPHPAARTLPPITGTDGKVYARANPIAAAQAEVKSQPVMLGGKAIERLDLFLKTVDAAGGPTAIAADIESGHDDELAAVWLSILERAADEIQTWQAALRRRNLRSVK